MTRPFHTWYLLTALVAGSISTGVQAQWNGSGPWNHAVPYANTYPAPRYHYPPQNYYRGQNNGFNHPRGNRSFHFNNHSMPTLPWNNSSIFHGGNYVWPLREGPWSYWKEPWDKGPWNSARRYGSPSNPWGNVGPMRWMNPADMQGNMERAWDDMLETPHKMGTMPGGWRAPSISVPNPATVGDEVGDTSQDAPGEAADQIENFKFGPPF